MMKKILALVLALSLMIPFAVAEDAALTEDLFVPAQEVKVHLGMDGVMQDGFICIPTVKNEGVVALDSMHYENGRFSFVFSPIAAGEAIVTLEYMKPADRFVEHKAVYMIVVTEEGLVEVRDMTEQLPLVGTVKEITEEGILLETVDMGEIICRMPEGMVAPMQDELVQVWFNGVMTMSLPAQINVLAWELVTMQAR